jgi:hypothetical protein
MLELRLLKKLVELLQEAQIAFIEQTQIVDAVTQHRQALRPEPNAKPMYFSGSSPMLRITAGCT